MYPYYYFSLEKKIFTFLRFLSNVMQFNASSKANLGKPSLRKLLAPDFFKKINLLDSKKIGFLSF